jgi:dynein heavy chain
LHAKVKDLVEEYLDQLPSPFNTQELQQLAEDLITSKDGPFVILCLQECVRMNTLLEHIKDSLIELHKGLRGQLNMVQWMEDMMEALALNQVPGRNPLHACSWERVAWPSTKSLRSWFVDLRNRYDQLQMWSTGSFKSPPSPFALPYSIWLPGLFNPTSFLTAIKQIAARYHQTPLDQMTIETSVTKLSRPELAFEKQEYVPDGALIHGLFIDGARWSNEEEADEDSYTVESVSCGGHLNDAQLKQLFPPMPLVYVRAVPVSRSMEASPVGFLRKDRFTYNCPVFMTIQRGLTYVFLATLKTIDDPKKWVLSGVALIMQLSD